VKKVEIMEKQKVKTMTGAQMVVETLERLQVETIFGYPGGAILPIYDAMYDSNLKHVLTRHEQGAIHAAEGYARATGKVGTVMATSGPGATNLVTGIADAYMDSTPLVIITGQVFSSLIGTDGFQEVDVIGITLPVTKYSYQVRDAADLPRILCEAYYLAGSGRPGPVLVDIPKDVSLQEAPYIFPEDVAIEGYQVKTEPDLSIIEQVKEEIAKAKKPLLYVGGGIIHSEASKELLEFANRTGIPVTSTLMGLGSFPQDHPLYLGMLGMHGTYAANMAIYHADLLIACGVRFDDRVTGKLERFSPNSKKVHIDIDPAEIGKNVKIDYPLVCDVKKALTELLKNTPKPDCKEWVQQVQSWYREYPLTYKKESSDEIKPQYVIECLSRLTDGDAIITTEVGQHQMWAALFYRFKKPRTFVTSGGLGTMGYGFPAAIGAQIARPDQNVICIAGDASIQMCLQELQTVMDQKLPVKIFILNNHFLGMVRQWQEMFHDHRYSETRISSPDFVKVAEAYGMTGLRATKADEVEETIKKAIATPGPVIAEFVVVEEENVFPMVPQGKGLDEMLLTGWED
jgi:acetolactate synthase-1/2/3 large subunit